MQPDPGNYGEIPYVPERMTLLITVEVNRTLFRADIVAAVHDAIERGCMRPIEVRPVTPIQAMVLSAEDQKILAKVHQPQPEEVSHADTPADALRG